MGKTYKELNIEATFVDVVLFLQNNMADKVVSKSKLLRMLNHNFKIYHEEQLWEELITDGILKESLSDYGCYTLGEDV